MSNNILSKKEIVDSIQKSTKRLQTYGIRTIGLFGSFVRGEETEQSDVDILVQFDAEKKNFDNFIDACFFLEELFQRKIELVTEESLSPYLKPHIMKEVEYVSLTN
jgi:predicted nucleotidyltransferase